MQAPCGSWRSPVTTDLIVADTVRLSYPGFAVGGGADTVYWIEGRPSEAGRSVLVRRGADGVVEDVTPPPFNVRTRVHEYGGLAWVARVAGGEETVWFVHDGDQRVYELRRGGQARALTPTGTGWRFADLTIDPARPRLLAVAERTRPDDEPENLLAAIDLRTGAVEPLVTGHDFFATPRPSPDGRQLAYLAWDHPNMPWDAAGLFVARLDEAGRPGTPRLVAGDHRASAFQPGWAPRVAHADDTLVFAYEPTGYWTLHRLTGHSIEPFGPTNAECGLPLWQLGMATWGFVGPRDILAAYTRDGQWSLARGSLDDVATSPLPTPWTSISHVATSPEGAALLVGASATEPQSIVRIDVATGRSEVLRRSSAFALDAAFVSVPEPISFPTTAGDTAHAFFYPPKNGEFEPLPGEKPPLVVIAHGGPTAATSAVLSPAVQFWTTRGFAVLDVNYRGSTGYGRAYRDRLSGQWGVYDVDDCVAGARALAAAGRVDGARLAIRGGSAGGFTALAALAFHDVFRAGASHYGVSDLEALARDTHKFESRYLDGLIGAYPARRDLYVQRSPIHAADRLSCPVIFFQGLEDKVVPPNQAETMVEALRRKRIPVAYVAFEGEQHGFRKADSIRRALESELAFYGRVFGFVPDGPLPPLTIDNL